MVLVTNVVVTPFTFNRNIVMYWRPMVNAERTTRGANDDVSFESPAITSPSTNVIRTTDSMARADVIRGFHCEFPGTDRRNTAPMIAPGMKPRKTVEQSTASLT